MFYQLKCGRTLQNKFEKRYMSVYAEHVVGNLKTSPENIENNVKPVNWDAAKPFNSIPGPKPIPIFGNLLKFLPGIGPYCNLDQITLQQRLKNEFGNIVKISDVKFKNDMVFIYNPDDIALSYRNEGLWPDRPGLDPLFYYRTKVRPDIFKDNGGILTAQGKDWYNIRSVTNSPLMQPRSAQQYIPGIDEVGRDFSERVRFLAGKNDQCEMPENFLIELNKFSVESINLIGLNKRLGLFEGTESSTADTVQFIKCIPEVIQLLYELEFKVSLWKWISTPQWKRYIRVLDTIIDFELKHFNEALRKINWEALNSKSDNELCILERLLKKDKERTFSIFFDMMFGSVDTSSRTIGAALYYLSLNQNTQDKLRSETRKLLPQHDTPITKDILNEMSYLRAVIKETQRLAPVNVTGARKSHNNLVLSGYQVPKGVDLLFPHLLLCREEKYFPRSNEFIPERWLRGKNKEYVGKDANPFVFLPFGFGTRSCVGRRLAQLQMEILLPRLVRNFQITWPHQEMKWSTNLSYGVASPLKFHLKPAK